MLCRSGAASVEQKKLLCAIGFDMDSKLVKYCREKYTNKKDAGRLFFETAKIDCCKRKDNPGKFVLTDACANDINNAVGAFIKQAVGSVDQNLRFPFFLHRHLSNLLLGKVVYFLF